MKKLFALILAVCLLSGCSLATDLDWGRGELVGFFLTVSRQNPDGSETEIWDAEAAGMDFLSNYKLTGKKLWAKQVGEGEDISYEFPAGCGLSSFCYDVFEDGEAVSRTSISSPEVVAPVNYYLGDPGSMEMNATVYAPQGMNAVVCMNPVYQTRDGEIYALSDRPMGYVVDGIAGWTSYLSQEGEGMESKIFVTVEYVVLPETYVIHEMDENNLPLGQSEFAPGELPERYTPGADAAYLILEARAGEDTVRTVYSPGDRENKMDTYYPGEYGFCIKGYTKIDWEGAK